jgi:hypothetical protein
MPEQNHVSTLIGGLIEDLQQLVRQEIALARREIRDEWENAKQSALMLGAGAAVLGLAAIPFVFMFVWLLHLAIPYLWVCFGIVAAVLFLVGGSVLAVGLKKINELHVVPPRTVATLEQDVKALTNPMASDRSAGTVAQR